MPPPGGFKASYGTRHTGSQQTVSITLLIDFACRVEKHLPVCGCRRSLAKIQCLGRTSRSVVNQHEAAAAQIASPWQHHRQGKSGRHCSIYRVASLRENTLTNRTGQASLGNHHTTRGNDGMMQRVIAQNGRLGGATHGRPGAEREQQERDAPAAAHPYSDTRTSR